MHDHEIRVIIERTVAAIRDSKEILNRVNYGSDYEKRTLRRIDRHGMLDAAAEGNLGRVETDRSG